MSMTIGSNNPAVWTPNIKTRTPNELESHPAFHLIEMREAADKVLFSTEFLPYILWKEKSTDLSFLSFTTTALTVGWFYQDADPHFASTLADLIPRTMHCTASKCKMLINLDYYPYDTGC
jgi:hypothetical protein